LAVSIEWNETMQCTVILETFQGHTDHLSNILADQNFLAGCYLFTVSSTGLLFIRVCSQLSLLAVTLTVDLWSWAR